jgi:hypothetical protein
MNGIEARMLFYGAAERVNRRPLRRPTQALLSACFAYAEKRVWLNARWLNENDNGRIKMLVFITLTVRLYTYINL